MPEAIKYETTTIPARRTAGEIMELLAEYGARHVSLEYDSEGEPAAVSFAIHDPKLGQLVPVHLRARTEAVARRLLEVRPWNSRRRAAIRAEYEREIRAQAHRIVWRHLKDLIEQQLLAVRIGQYELTDVFMHGLMLQDGSTVGERFREHADRLLGTGLMQLLPGGE